MWQRWWQYHINQVDDEKAFQIITDSDGDEIYGTCDKCNSTDYLDNSPEQGNDELWCSNCVEDYWDFEEQIHGLIEEQQNGNRR